MKKISIENYIDMLSSSVSMPGGGSVSALAGAQSMALVLMVCNLTIGKKKYIEYENLIEETIKGAKVLREIFLKLMQDDVEYFKEMEKVFKMPNTTDEEKKLKANEMEKACKICCEVPIETIKLSLEGITLVKNIIGKSNSTAVSDLGIAAINLKTAAMGAWLNININLKYINDENFINKCKYIENNELVEIIKMADNIYVKT